MHRLVLVRHCESSGQAPAAELTATGHAQARALADLLLPLGIDRIVSSPFTRAVQTIEPFAQLSGLGIGLDDRLTERRLSPEPIDNWREEIQRSFDEPDHCLPGGESARIARTRGWAAIDALLNGEHRLPTAVAHGQLLSFVLHSIDPRFGFAQWGAMANPDVFILERTASGEYQFRRLGSDDETTDENR